MSNHYKKVGLVLALGCFFVTVPVKSQTIGADVSALTQLADDYAAQRMPGELSLAIEKLGILREKWEATGRPGASLSEIAVQKRAWQKMIAQKVQDQNAKEDSFGEIVHLPYIREFNGSTLAKGEVVVTFDDGPHPTLTPMVHAIVKNLMIPAAFFEIGQNVKMYPNITKNLAAEGYVIGDHSWDHPDLTKLDDQKVQKEINDTQAVIQNVLGGQEGFNQYFHTFFAQFFKMPEVIYAPEFFRSPYGDRSARTMNIISDTVVGEAEPIVNGKMVLQPDKMYHIMWNVDSLDWQDHDPASIEKRVFDQLATFGHHGIILFHDIHPQTISAIQLILPRLVTEGYKCVSLYDLVAEVEAKEGDYLSKP